MLTDPLGVGMETVKGTRLWLMPHRGKGAYWTSNERVPGKRWSHLPRDGATEPILSPGTYL